MDDALNARRLPPLRLAPLLLCALAALAQAAAQEPTSAQTAQVQAPPVQTGQTVELKQPPAQETIPKQTGTPLPLKPDLPGMQRNHRLILTDGTYQLVRQYQILGDRVRYFSAERSDWEEIPVSLVDWDATRKWERDHTPSADTSPAMQEAEEVDKEELAARDEQRARMPLVAPGLELPDQDGAFVLDTYHGTPEIVQLTETDMRLNTRNRHGLGVLDPKAGMNANLELNGAHSRIYLHVNDPAIYFSLAAPDDNREMLGHAMVVKTDGARAVNDVHGADSAASRFAIVRVDERNMVRIVDPVHLNADGTVAQSDNVILTRTEVVPGKHWLCVHPAQPLEIGEYALIEIDPSAGISPNVWDFRVDPTKGDNPGSLTPILAPVDSREPALNPGVPGSVPLSENPPIQDQQPH